MECEALTHSREQRVRPSLASPPGEQPICQDSLKAPLLAVFYPSRIQENGSLITILVIAGVFWVHRLIKFIYNICCYWEIHSFYLHALRIPMVRLGRWAVSAIAQDAFFTLVKVGCIPGLQASSAVISR